MRRKKVYLVTMKNIVLVIYLSCFIAFILSVILFFAANSSVMQKEKKPQLAIVIDDFGRQRAGVCEMISLPCKITCAVIPFLEHSEDDAQSALENGKEVIIHIPMQATLHDPTDYLGNRYIKASSGRKEVTELISDAMDELPEAVGANIHMGTICSSKKEIMEPVIKTLKKRNLLFLDSMTSPHSVCREVAEKENIVFYENDVFLEHESKTTEYVKSRLKKAEDIALKTGKCIVIGHVGCEGGKITSDAISEMLDEFRENNIDIVFLSEIK